MTWTLCQAPSACSRAGQFALAELAIPYTLMFLDRAARAARTPEFLRLDSDERVPAFAAKAGALTGFGGQHMRTLLVAS